jgi:hypothetical protein
MKCGNCGIPDTVPKIICIELFMIILLISYYSCWAVCRVIYDNTVKWRVETYGKIWYEHWEIYEGVIKTLYGFWLIITFGSDMLRVHDHKFKSNKSE